MLVHSWKIMSSNIHFKKMFGKMLRSLNCILMLTALLEANKNVGCSATNSAANSTIKHSNFTAVSALYTTPALDTNITRISTASSPAIISNNGTLHENKVTTNKTKPIIEKKLKNKKKRKRRKRKRRKRPRQQNALTENQQKLCIALFSIVAIVGVVGNSLVVYIYGFTARKRYLKFERLMLILGIVDLIALLTNPLLYIYQLKTQYSRWDFGKVGCKILPALGPLSISVSIGVILIMSIDRDRAVVTPFKKQYTTQTIYKAIAFTIFAATILVSPYMYYQHLNKRGICKVNAKYIEQYALYGLIVFLSSDILFLLILGVTTVRVFIKLSKAKVISHPKSKEFRARETKRILRIITAMGITFVILIFPRDLVQMAYMYTFLNPPVIKIPNYLFVNAILKLLHTSNSSVNVFLYSIVNRRFRKDVLKLFMKSRYFRKLTGYQAPSESSSLSDTTRYTRSRYNSSKMSKSTKSGRLPAELTPLKTPTTESLNKAAIDSPLHD